MDKQTKEKGFKMASNNSPETLGIILRKPELKDPGCGLVNVVSKKPPINVTRCGVPDYVLGPVVAISGLTNASCVYDVLILCLQGEKTLRQSAASNLFAVKLNDFQDVSMAHKRDSFLNGTKDLFQTCP